MKKQISYIGEMVMNVFIAVSIFVVLIIGVFLC